MSHQMLKVIDLHAQKGHQTANYEFTAAQNFQNEKQTYLQWAAPMLGQLSGGQPAQQPGGFGAPAQ